MWACPHCSEALQLTADRSAWACENRHQFDCASEGYVNLLPANRKRSRHPGDSPQMMAARGRVHEAGLYRHLSVAIEDMLAPIAPVANMLDLGCGEGYYGDALQRAQPAAQLYGIDIAKGAIRLAARRHSGARFAVASAYRLPLLDGCQQMILRVFAPSDDRELRRVLAPQAAYLEVTPAPRHLWQLREQLYDRPRAHCLARTEIPQLALQIEREVEYAVELDRGLLQDLIAMTPFAHRGHREKREQLLRREGLSVQMAFSLRLFRAS